ncbi:hypothetical protein C0995_014122 [Termitomyces sp. Mi166|nr:hypothetical protein C0995_014122 [Termitomyces sp. Mi166\
MASIPPTDCQGGILPAPLPQPVTAPAKTTNTSGADSGLEKWHHLNPGNLATGNLSANAAPDAQQQQAMNNMQAPAAATLVHEIVQEPREDQYMLTTNERIEYHQQEFTNTKAGPSCQKEPKNTDEKLLPKDKEKKLMKPTVEEIPEEALSPIHPYSGIPEISISEPTPKNVATGNRQQEDAYEMLALAATKEQEGP